MCLALPGKILEMDLSDPDLKMAKVSFSGVVKNICMEGLPEAGVGDYVLVHVGFAISKVDEADALESIKLLEQMGNGLDEISG